MSRPWWQWRYMRERNWLWTSPMILPEIQQWLDTLSDTDREELHRLWLLRGTYTEDAMLDDWIADHGGQRWYRWYALRGRDFYQELEEWGRR